VLVADLLGHADLGTLKIYTQPNDAGRERALRCSPQTPKDVVLRQSKPG
jgi:hypothetical protein